MRAWTWTLFISLAPLQAQSRLPVPSGQAAHAAQSWLDALLASESQGLADRLLALSARQRGAKRYALLEQARRIGVRIRRPETALRACWQLVESFDVDAVSKLRDTLAAFGAITGKRQQRVLALSYLRLAELTRRTGKSEVGKRALDRAAELAKSAGDSRIEALVHDKQEELEAIAGVDRDSPLFAALWLGDFSSLGKPRDRELSIASALSADRRARQSGTVDDRLAAARAWSAQAARVQPSVVQHNLRRRALYWFGAAYDGLAKKQRGAVVREVLRIYSRLLPRSGPGLLRFRNEADLRTLVLQNGDWSIAGRRLHAKSKDDRALSTYEWAYDRLECVRFRGTITSENGHNFRFTVGPINAILNWEGADENHFRNTPVREKVVTRPRLLRHGEEHDIVVCQIGVSMVVTVDGAIAFETKGRLRGTVSVYPAFSEIAVREIAILGRIDPGHRVTGPTHRWH